MNINLSKFHKIECDDNCTTLEHPTGHQIKIAHKGLSHEMREELNQIPMKMAKGGYAKFSQKFDPNMRSKNSEAAKASKPLPEESYTPPKEAKNSFTEPDNLGTAKTAHIPGAPSRHEPDDLSAGARNAYYGTHGVYPPCINSSCKSYGMPHPNCRCYGPSSEAGHFYAEGGEVEYYCDDIRAHKKGCDYYKEGGKVEKSEGMSDAGKNIRHANTRDQLSPSARKMFQESAKYEHKENLSDIKSMSPKLKGLADGGMPDAGQEYTQEDQGAEMAADASENKPENVGPELQNEVNDYQKEIAPQQEASAPQEAALEETQELPPVQQFQQHKEKNLQELANESQMFQQDMDAGHIKPETYHDLFAKKETLGKIGTMFGLLLSGAGSGLSGQPNMLMGMMDKEIERDLQAQQHSVENKQNFLKINQQGVDSATKAYALSRVQMNNAALHSLVSETQKLPPGPQKEQALQTLAVMNQSVQNENFNIMDRAATSAALSHVINGGGNTTLMKSGLLGPEMKEVGSDVEQKTIPGIPGRASRPIDSKDRDQIQAMKVLSDKANDLINFSKKHVGTLSPQQRAVAQQKAEEMINFYNHSIQGGVLTEGRLKWLDDQIKKNPTGIVTQLMGNNARLQEIKDSNDHRKNLLLKSYGYQVKDVGNAGSSPETKMMHGAQYQKVNGGWKKVQ